MTLALPQTLPTSPDRSLNPDEVLPENALAKNSISDGNGPVDSIAHLNAQKPNACFLAHTF